jgi:hypothetical protein
LKVTISKENTVRKEFLNCIHLAEEALTPKVDAISRNPQTVQDNLLHVNLRYYMQYGYTMKNGVFWVVTACGSCKNRRFGGTWRLLHQGDKNR